MKYFSIIGLLFCCIIPAKSQSDDAIYIIKKIIGQKDKNYIQNSDYYQFEQYEKLSMSVNKLPGSMQKQEVVDKFDFIFNNIDTTNVAAGKTLTFAVRETLSDEYRRKKQQSQRSVIKAIRQEGLDKKLQTETIDALWREAVKQINIFEPEIDFLFKRFTSPVGQRGISCYHYNIEGNVIYNGLECIRLSFTPKNQYDLNFTGELWIQPDTSAYYIRKAIFNIPQETNINFIAGLRIVQEFNPVFNGVLAKTREVTNVNFSVFKIYYQLLVKNERRFDNYQITDEEPVRFGLNDIVAISPDAGKLSGIQWDTIRPVPLTQNEINADTVKFDPDGNTFSYLLRQIVQILISDYAHTGKSALTSKFDIGPVWSTLSHNEIEGFRFRLGGTTTAVLNNHFFVKGYAAYGTKDEKIKYSGTATYSLKEKHYHENEYPKNNFSFTYQYDVHTPGKTSIYTNPDNFFFSFKRGDNDKMTLKREADFSYEHEYPSGFYWKAWSNSWNEKAIGSLQFLKQDVSGNIINVGDYNASELGLALCFSFNEKFFQGRDSRILLKHDGPVFVLSQSLGLKNFLGGEYSYYLTELTAQKCFWLPGRGHINTILKGGKLWGNVPFPLLILPNANQTYTILPEAYSLMNTLEFINDKYASIDISYNMDGWLFNRIPFIQKLKWREVISFKALTGSLSSDNNPQNNPDLFLFPEDSHTMGKMPYMEAAIGIENIFKLLRVDYVRRLSYLDHENIDKGGLRVTIIFSF